MSQNALFSQLVERFAPYMTYAASSFPDRHREDLIQEGYLGLYSACGAYDAHKDVPFDAFAKICIKHRMLTAYKMMRKDDEALVFDDNVFENIGTADESVSQKLEVKDFFNKLRQSLSELENNVLDEYLQDLSYEQIAKNLNITQKQADNTIARIKRKIKDKYTI